METSWSGARVCARLEPWAAEPSFETHRFAMLLRMRLRDASRSLSSGRASRGPVGDAPQDEGLKWPRFRLNRALCLSLKNTPCSRSRTENLMPTEKQKMLAGELYHAG